MTVEIFAHKGYVGADINMNGKFINDPKAPTQLGCVIDTAHVKISPEAVRIIKTAKREGGSFAELMLSKHSPLANPDFGKSSIGIVGGGKVMIGKEKQIMIGRDCDLSVLHDCSIEEFEAPDDFKCFVEELDR
jgi:hypothetical protein